MTSSVLIRYTYKTFFKLFAWTFIKNIFELAELAELAFYSCHSINRG